MSEEVAKERNFVACRTCGPASYDPERGRLMTQALKTPKPSKKAEASSDDASTDNAHDIEVRTLAHY
jgi:hypothetical protein